jgi:UPF0755 protein
MERRLRRRRRARGLTIVVLLLAAASGVAAGAVRLTGRHHPPRVAPGQRVTITVAAGESSAGIARSLLDAGVIDSMGRFRAVAAERGLDAELKPGTYELTTGMDVDEVLDLLARGPSLGRPFTIPEGFTVRQIVERIAATHRFSVAELDRALKSRALISPYRPRGKASLEGLLFPDTYYIKPDDTAVTVLQRMLDRLQEVLSDYELSDIPERLSTYQILIVASMIEREAKVPGDRPKVARVIYNRLHAHKLLQIDATVQYAIGHPKKRLSDQDLHVHSPYNTYKYAGLPPTPIASPGEAAIRAALQPASGDWLYYVLIAPDGRHAFTASAAEFQRLKAQAKAKGLL